VIRLINRRFVPLYFDLQPGAPMADAKARKFVTDALEELAGPGVDTPPLLVMTPDGEVLKQIDNYASEDDCFHGLQDALALDARWQGGTKSEVDVALHGDALARAELWIDLGRFERARALLAATPGPEAALRLAHLARLQGDFAAIEPALAKVDEPRFAADVHLERAWLRLHEGRFDEARAAAALVATESPRHSEARYLAGVVEFRDGQRDAALAIWKSLVTSCSQDRWIYRADWAYTQTLDGERRTFTTNDPKRSLLGRIGYMQRHNPDLEAPPKPVATPTPDPVPTSRH
jgi:tetratricopeptide (TPR) repeat protein